MLWWGLQEYVSYIQVPHVIHMWSTYCQHLSTSVNICPPPRKGRNYADQTHALSIPWWPLWSQMISVCQPGMHARFGFTQRACSLLELQGLSPRSSRQESQETSRTCSEDVSSILKYSEELIAYSCILSTSSEHYHICHMYAQLLQTQSGRKWVIAKES